MTASELRFWMDSEYFAEMTSGEFAKIKRLMEKDFR